MIGPMLISSIEFVFIREMQYVYCAVGTEFLNTSGILYHAPTCQLGGLGLVRG